MSRQLPLFDARITNGGSVLRRNPEMAKEQQTHSEPEQLAKALGAMNEIQYERLVEFFEKAGRGGPVCHCKCQVNAAGASAKAV
jgi:hypothetical protein